MKYLNILLTNSKYKDYYDFYTGIFGIDNNKIYNRRDVVKLDDEIHKHTWEHDECKIIFAICNTQYTMYYFDGNLYHTPDELQELDIKLKEKSTSRYGGLRMGFSTYGLKRNTDIYTKKYNMENGVPIGINIKKREPVLFSYMSNRYVSRNSKHNWKVPLLESFEFYKILDPKELYIQISTFLGWLVDNPPLPDTQTNIGKIESHGFDKKRSFRPNMK